MTPDAPGRPAPRSAPHRYVVQVWTDAGPFCATVQSGAEPIVTFHEPDDVLLFLYRRLLRREPPPP